MALRNYLYAKHANDPFALALIGKSDANKDTHIASGEVQPIQPIEDISKCKNCAECKDCDKTKPKVPVELEMQATSSMDRELDLLNSGMQEVDFTNKF